MSEDADYLESVQKLKFRLSIQTKVQLWYWSKIYPKYHLVLPKLSTITIFWKQRFLKVDLIFFEDSTGLTLFLSFVTLFMILEGDVEKI